MPPETTAAPFEPPAGSPVLLNPFEEGFFDDPYAQYERLRAVDPVHRSPIGVWVLLRHADVVAVLRDPTLSVEERHVRVDGFPVDPEIEALRERRGDRGTRAMLNLDPPDHHRLRRLVSKVFTPHAVEALRPRVRTLVDEALDAVAGRDEMDVIADLAFPLPFTVISEMMGIPEGRDRLELRSWSSALVKTLDPIMTADEARAALDAADAMRDYLEEIIEHKRAHPDDRLLCALLDAEDAGDRLSPEELIDQVVLLYVAGHETTVNLVGNGTLALLRHRGELERLQGDPSLDASAVEELLRYDSPVQMTRRVTVEDRDIAGRTVEAGSFVMCLLGAANRDPEEWGETAAELDLGRPGAERHVSFGGGFHHCLGAALARLEGQEAIGRLVRRYPRLELAVERPRWNGRIVLRGLDTLPVALG